jgi:excisionase family DNA binding protein
MQNTDADTRAALGVGRLAYPINDLAEALGIGRSKIYEEIRDGRLQAKKLGSRTLITAQAASDYLAHLPDIAAKAA